MLQNLTLDYIQHLERGYCANHPDVIAQTKEQVVDRAVKQLLTALQSNGFELDGNILKRGNGWLQYDATESAWQYSNDAGATWQAIGAANNIPKTYALACNGTDFAAQADFNWKDDYEHDVLDIVALCSLNATPPGQNEILWKIETAAGQNILEFGLNSQSPPALYLLMGSSTQVEYFPILYLYLRPLLNEFVCSYEWGGSNANVRISVNGRRFSVGGPFVPTFPAYTQERIKVGKINGQLHRLMVSRSLGLPTTNHWTFGRGPLFHKFDACYTCSAGTGTTLADIQGDYNLTLTNAASWVEV